MSSLRVALWAGKRREQGFGCGRRKSPTARGGIGFDIGSRGRLKRRRPRSHCGCAGEFVHRLLLEALGLELDRLDPGAKEFGGCAVNERGRRFQRAPHGAQRYDRQFQRWRNATFELSDLACRQRPLSPRMPEQKQEQIDVDAGLLLQEDAGVSDAILPVEAQREAPERRSRGGGRRHARALSVATSSDLASSSICASTLAESGTPLRSRSALRAARPMPGTRISSRPGSRCEDMRSRMWRSTSALNASSRTNRATSKATTNCPTLPFSPAGAAKSRISRPNAARFRGPANSPMTRESPLPL